MGGTLDLVQRAFLGTEVRGDVLSFSPRLPDRLDGLSFRMQFRGVPLRVSFHGSELTIAALSEGVDRPVRVAAGGRVEELHPGQRCSLPVVGAASGHEAQEEERDVRGL
jgi:trehalose/maltose hydrolase-like predicted phosphorylase